MGLDFVEIVFAAEGHFRVSLHDTDVSKCDSVGEFAALVESAARPENRGPGVALSDATRLLVEQLGVEREAIKPDARLAELVPLNRRVLWRKVVANDQRVPPLVASPLAELILMLLLIAGVTPLLSCCAATVVASGALFVGSVACFVLALVIRWMGARKFRVHFPSSLVTVDDLGRMLTPVSPASDCALSYEDWVFEEVRALVANVACVPREKIERTTRFAEILS